MLSVGDISKLAQLGGTSLALSLLVVLVALWRGWLEIGPAARREVAFWTALSTQMKTERDEYKAQVESRQNVVETMVQRSMDLADLLKEYAQREGRRGPERGGR